MHGVAVTVYCRPVAGPTDSAPERVFTLPNLLTLSRLPLAALVWVAPGEPRLVIPVMVAAAITDVLDGRFARAIRGYRERHGRPVGNLAEAGAIGAWLDPLCDKTFVLSVVAAVFVATSPPLWVVGLIGAREIVVVPLAVGYRAVPGLRQRMRFDFRAGPLGKLATVTQFVAVGALLLAPAWSRELAWAAGVSGALAALVYLRRALRGRSRESARM